MKKRTCLIALMVGMVQTGLHAQTTVTSGIIRGVVSDSSGAVVPGATIVLLAGETNQHLARTTNDAGIFVFPSQPVGLYVLEASAAGFLGRRVEPVNVEVGQTTTVNLRLQPGTDSESITVSGESPLLRTEDSNQSSVVGRDFMDSLPLSGRRFLDFALLEPNVTADGQSGLISFAGEQGGRTQGTRTPTVPIRSASMARAPPAITSATRVAGSASPISSERMRSKNSRLQFHPTARSTAAPELVL